MLKNTQQLCSLFGHFFIKTVHILIFSRASYNFKDRMNVLKKKRQWSQSLFCPYCLQQLPQTTHPTSVDCQMMQSPLPRRVPKFFRSLQRFIPFLIITVKDNQVNVLYHLYSLFNFYPTKDIKRKTVKDVKFRAADTTQKIAVNEDVSVVHTATVDAPAVHTLVPAVPGAADEFGYLIEFTRTNTDCTGQGVKINILRSMNNPL